MAESATPCLYPHLSRGKMRADDSPALSDVVQLIAFDVLAAQRRHHLAVGVSPGCYTQIGPRVLTEGRTGEEARERNADVAEGRGSEMVGCVLARV